MTPDRNACGVWPRRSRERTGMSVMWSSSFPARPPRERVTEVDVAVHALGTSGSRPPDQLGEGIRIVSLLLRGLTGDLTGDESLGWKVTCLGANREIFRLPLRETGAVSGEFVIPGDCRAQRIALAARAPDVPNAADFRISGLQLTRLRG